jgi:hypothetical protein
MKLYKDSNNLFWLNGTVTKPEQYELIVDGERVSVVHIESNKTLYIGLAAGIEKSSGTYTDLADFLSTNKEFFRDNSGLLGALDTINTSILSSGGAVVSKLEVEITRPANTTAYSIGDVITHSTGTNPAFTNAAKSAGKAVTIVGAAIKIDSSAAAGARFNLRLYDEAPVAIADNSPYAFTYTNKKAGTIPIVMGTGAKAN